MFVFLLVLVLVVLVVVSSHLALGPLRDGWVGGVVVGRVLCGEWWSVVVSCWSASPCARSVRPRMCLRRHPRVSKMRTF